MKNVKMRQMDSKVTGFCCVTRRGHAQDCWDKICIGTKVAVDRLQQDAYKKPTIKKQMSMSYERLKRKRLQSITAAMRNLCLPNV